MRYYSIAHADNDILKFGLFKSRADCEEVLAGIKDVSACYVTEWSGDGGADDEIVGQLNGEEFLVGHETL